MLEIKEPTSKVKAQILEARGRMLTARAGMEFLEKVN